MTARTLALASLTVAFLSWSIASAALRSAWRMSGRQGRIRRPGDGGPL